MTVAYVLLSLLLALAAVHASASLLPHVLLRPYHGGLPENGLVIFVEGIRFMGIPWDLRPAGAGLRKAGFDGWYLYWQWHADWRGWLVLPALMSRRLHEQQARRLADFIVAQQQKYPHRPIWLIGCSAGCHVGLRALELLPPGAKIQAAAMLAGAFEPRRDLSIPCERLVGPLVVSVSPVDFWIIGLGTLLFGTADRRHTPSAGMIGLRGPANAANIKRGKIIPIRWRPTMLLIGHMGGHFSSATPNFIARHIAPALGVGPGITSTKLPDSGP